MPLSHLPSDLAKQLVFVPSFLPDHEAVFQSLLSAVAWDSRLKKRMTASFGVSYNYSGLTYPEVPFSELVADLCKRATPHLGFAPNNALLNLYESGEDSMGFHADASARLGPSTGIGVVSLGSARPLTFRRAPAASPETFSVTLPPGSLLRMSVAMQADWHHALLRREAHTRPEPPIRDARISVTFRRIENVD